MQAASNDELCEIFFDMHGEGRVNGPRVTSRNKRAKNNTSPVSFHKNGEIVVRFSPRGQENQRRRLSDVMSLIKSLGNLSKFRTYI